jgi:hypothetical protein
MGGEALGIVLIQVTVSQQVRHFEGKCYSSYLRNVTTAARSVSSLFCHIVGLCCCVLLNLCEVRYLSHTTHF